MKLTMAHKHLLPPFHLSFPCLPSSPWVDSAPFSVHSEWEGGEAPVEVGPTWSIMAAVQERGQS